MEQVQTPERKYPEAGVYEHYKSTPEDRRYYQVIGVAQHTEEYEVLVVYVPLYVIPDHRGLRLQARPLAMFMSTVERDGQQTQRFTYIGPEL